MALVRDSHERTLAPTHPASAKFVELRCDILGEEHYDVFLSYRRTPADQQFAKHLYESLKRQVLALRVFLDDRALHPGRNFVAEFVQALGTCRVFVPVVSAHPQAAGMSCVTLTLARHCMITSCHYCVMHPIYSPTSNLCELSVCPPL